MKRMPANPWTIRVLAVMTRVLLATTPALMVGLPATSLAQSTDDERARLHFSAGRSYYEEGNYEQALVEFQRAYDLSQRPVLLVNIANSQERLGQWRAAADSLSRFVATLPEDDEQRATLARRIENLVQRADQHDAEQRAEPAPGVLETAPAEPSPPPPPATREGSDGLLVPALIAFGVGAAGLIAFATLGGLALAEESAVADGCGATVSCTPEQVQAMDDLALGADIALGVGVAGVATGTVLILVDPPRGPSTEVATARVLPFAARSSAGLLVHGTF